MDGWLRIALLLSGAFSTLLGLVHFVLPRLLDVCTAIPLDGPPLTPLRLGPVRYATTRRDVRGLTWVMNHAASYTLVGIGVADLLADRWLVQPGGRVLAAWIAGFWLLRAGSQLHLGRRRGDLLVLAGFAALGVLHLVAALA